MFKIFFKKKKTINEEIYGIKDITELLDKIKELEGEIQELKASNYLLRYEVKKQEYGEGMTYLQ